MCREQRERIPPAERSLASQQLIEKDSDRVEIAPVVDLVLRILPPTAPNLLGTHEGGRPKEIPGSRKSHFRAAILLDHLGDPKVQNLQVLALWLAIHQHEVGRFEVAVDDRLGLTALLIEVTMGLLQHGTELVKQRGDPFERELLPLMLLEVLVEASPAHELHLDVAHRVGSLEVVDDHRIGVLKLGHEPSLALEPPPSLIVMGDLGLDQFQGALPVKLEVVNQPDFAHASLADFFEEPVLAEDHQPNSDGRGGQQIPRVPLGRNI